MYAEVVHLPNPWAANPIRIVGPDVARAPWRRLPDGRGDIFQAAAGLGSRSIALVP
jgi:hypothetical protein